MYVCVSAKSGNFKDADAKTISGILILCWRIDIKCGGSVSNLNTLTREKTQKNLNPIKLGGKTVTFLLSDDQNSIVQSFGLCVWYCIRDGNNKRKKNQPWYLSLLSWCFKNILETDHWNLQLWEHTTIEM